MVQIYDGSSVPQRMVDGWNAFFFEDLDELVSDAFKNNSAHIPQSLSVHTTNYGVGNICVGVGAF